MTDASTPSGVALLAQAFERGAWHEVEAMAKQLLSSDMGYAPLAWKALGLMHVELGQSAQALTAMAQAIELAPEDAHNYVVLGSALKQMGQSAEAEQCLREAIRREPDRIDAHANLASLLTETGAADAAVKAAQRALELGGEVAELHLLHGNALLAAGHTEAAADAYQRAVRIRPDWSSAHNNLANAYRKLGELQRAIEALTAALTHQPDFPEALNNLGNCKRDSGDMAGAEEAFMAALRARPEQAIVYSNLSDLYHRLGRHSEALVAAQKAVELEPAYAAAWMNLGNAQSANGQMGPAEQSLRNAIELDATLATAYINLASLLNEGGALTQAEKIGRQAVELNPKSPQAFSNLAHILQDQGHLHEAVALYRQAIDLDPFLFAARSNLLFCLNYLNDISPQERMREALAYGEAVTAACSRVYTHDARRTAPTRAKRLGFISGDFRNHPVGYFFESVAKALAEEGVQLYAYYNHTKVDALTQRLQASFSVWRNIVGVSDAQVAAQIYADELDGLIDLSGHTAHNRLPVLAAKPAPIQASWIGYFATTGMREIDYFIADAYVVPPEDDDQFVEKVLRLPHSYLCFSPPDTNVHVGPLPALRNGYITFGCFNNLSKINEEVIDLWTQIMREIPSSRLILKAKQLRDQVARDRIHMAFEKGGVSAGRIDLEIDESRHNYFDAYNRVDIGLDPFPYPGGTTTLEAMWMGVPVVTLMGDRMLSRNGAGIAIHAGHNDWVAESKMDYLVLVKTKATQLSALKSVRDKVSHQLRADNSNHVEFAGCSAPQGRDVRKFSQVLLRLLLV